MPVAARGLLAKQQTPGSPTLGDFDFGDKKLDQKDLETLQKAPGHPIGFGNVSLDEMDKAFNELQNLSTSEAVEFRKQSQEAELRMSTSSGSISGIDRRRVGSGSSTDMRGVAPGEGGGGGGKPGTPIVLPTPNISNHVQASLQWWGIQVDIDHTGLQMLADAGDSAVSLLEPLVKDRTVATVIRIIIIVLRRVDRGSGIRFYFTWTTAIWWFLPL